MSCRWCELLDRRRFATWAEARLGVFDFLEGWYNPRRLHSALGFSNAMGEKIAALLRSS